MIHFNIILIKNFFCRTYIPLKNLYDYLSSTINDHCHIKDSKIIKYHGVTSKIALKIFLSV